MFIAANIRSTRGRARAGARLSRSCRCTLGALGVLVLLAGCAGAPVQAPGKPWHHLADGTFRNPPGSPARTATIAEMTAFMWRRVTAGQPSVPADHVVPAAEALAAYAAGAGADTITWLGHAAFLLRLGGTTVLTDPFLTEIAGPFGFGPRRYVEPGLPLDRLPPIDVVLISHNHYDHLDAETIEALPGKGDIQVVVPLGLGGFFRDRGYLNVHEHDWYERRTIAGIEIEFLPAVHFSRRGPFDRNRSLWGGFAIRTDAIGIYHSGDTGYGPVFREVGERAGPFELALVAVGAYEPRSIMKASHVTPEEAVQLIDDIGGRTAIGMHWGTIELTDEPVFEPGPRFLDAARAAGWPDGRARIMKIGETLRVAALTAAAGTSDQARAARGRIASARHERTGACRSGDGPGPRAVVHAQRGRDAEEAPGPACGVHPAGGRIRRAIRSLSQ